MKVTFQLTCPMRGTTFFSVIVRPFWIISTHVPHAGHDPLFISLFLP